MVFSSLFFLCAFLPAVLLGYYILPGIKSRNILLIIASLLFYAYGEPYYFLLMIASITLNYFFGLMTSSDSEKMRKSGLILAVFSNISLLFVFKYLDMFISWINVLAGLNLAPVNIPLPIGISFFTFQALSYVIDVYRNQSEVQKNYWNLMLYISFFPQLIAGPIVKYHDIQKQIENRKADFPEMANGFRRFTTGLAKKVLIANTMAFGVDFLMASGFAEWNILTAWTMALGYLFQIYFDFSGYSDMAIGLGHLFGFHFKENFNYPYISSSIQMFWRRWHISLSTWFKEYLYIPLGGNRKGKFRTSVNKLVVFMATGIWHGANITFLVWGLWHGFFIMLEQWIPKRDNWPKWFGWICTILIVILGFVVFRADTLRQGLQIIAMMFTGFDFSAASMALLKLVWTISFASAFILAILFSMPIVPLLKQKILNRSSNLIQTSYAVSFVLMIFLIAALSAGGYNPFIYFRF